MKQLTLDHAPARLRVGLPKPGGALLTHARSRGYSLLLSANSLVRDTASAAEARAWRAMKAPTRLNDEQRTAWESAPPPREFQGWRKDLTQLDGLDVALDSAGFVAWSRYGGYRWTVEQYVELASMHPWAWWAQMDACVEKAVAADPDVVRLRQVETLRLQGLCVSRACKEGVSPPMIVLQGRNAEDYIWHARRALTGRETLIGVGSMCTRPLYRQDGEDGLLDVVAALDAELRSGTKLHLFGVKAAGIRALGRHRRVAWVDSMAWDDASRWAAKGASNTNELRCAHMDAWVAKVEEARASASGLDLGPRRVQARETPEHLEEWADLIENDEIELSGALAHIERGV